MEAYCPNYQFNFQLDYLLEIIESTLDFGYIPFRIWVIKTKQ